MAQEATKQQAWQQAPDDNSNQQRITAVFAGYKGGEKMPLAGYAGLMGVFAAMSAGLLLVAKNTGNAGNTGNTGKNRNTENFGHIAHAEQTAAGQMNMSDILLGGVATYKLSRIISKDRVTSPLRAPFTEFEEPAGTSEVKEKTRGTGVQRAIGDLLTCPYCMGPWVATALGYGFVARPRAARLLSGIFAAVAVSDFLHHAIDAINKKEEEKKI